MNASTSLKTILLIAIASVVATGLELAGIDSLAAPRTPAVGQAVVQLPTVYVTAQSQTQAVVQLPTVYITAPSQSQAVATVQQLPRVVIVGHRDELTATARRSASEI